MIQLSFAQSKELLLHPLNKLLSVQKMCFTLTQWHCLQLTLRHHLSFICRQRFKSTCVINYLIIDFDYQFFIIDD